MTTTPASVVPMRDQQPPCRLVDPTQRVHKNAEPGKPHLRWVARDWGRPDTRRPLFLIAPKARMRNEGTSRKLRTGGGRPFPCPTRVEPFPFAVALAGRPAWPGQPSCQARSILLPGPLSPPARPAQLSCLARSTLPPGPLNPPARQAQPSCQARSPFPCKCIRPECGTGQTSLDVAG